MFVRIDTDLFVNINNMFSYKISDTADAYKLQIWSSNGNIIHSIFYLKDVPSQMQILLQFNDVMQDLVVNPERISPQVNINEGLPPLPEENQHLEETIEEIKEEN